MAEPYEIHSSYATSYDPTYSFRLGGEIKHQLIWEEEYGGGETLGGRCVLHRGDGSATPLDPALTREDGERALEAAKQLLDDES